MFNILLSVKSITDIYIRNITDNSIYDTKGESCIIGLLNFKNNNEHNTVQVSKPSL